jgi:hypothetical protein
MVTTWNEYKDNAIGELNAPITDTATSFTLKSGQGARFPDGAVTQVVTFFRTDPDLNNEKVDVSNRTGDVFTMTRRAGAQPWAADDRVMLSWLTEEIEAIEAAINQNETDIANIISGAQTLVEINVSGDANIGGNIDCEGTIEMGSGGNVLTNAAGLIDGGKIQTGTVDTAQLADDAVDNTKLDEADAYEMAGLSSSATIEVENFEDGQSAITNGMTGIQTVTDAMDSTSKLYGKPIMFLSQDGQFTTENPKLLAVIAPRATEDYAADTDGGMAVDVFTTPNNPGAVNVPILAVTANEDQGFDVVGDILSVGGNLWLLAKTGVFSKIQSLTASLQMIHENAGNSRLFFEPKPTDGTSIAEMRYMRNTNTVGDRLSVWYKGDGTATATMQLDHDAGDLQMDGDLGVGTDTDLGGIIVFSGSATASGGDTTPSVLGIGVLVLESGVTYTDFDDGVEGQMLHIVGGGGAPSTIDVNNPSGPIRGNGGADISIVHGLVTALYKNSAWRVPTQ